MSDQISLIVNGVTFEGWKRAEVTRGIEAIAGDFALEFADRWSEKQEIWEITPGAACSVLVGYESVINGYIDTVDIDLAADTHSLSLTGRDKTGDLVDCSAVHTPDEWKNIKIDTLVTLLCAPFGIPVNTGIFAAQKILGPTFRTESAGIGEKFPVFKLQPGETVFEAIDRACKMRALLPVPDGAGGLTLTRRGTVPSAVKLMQGQNILRARRSMDYTERFSEYAVLAQQGGKSLDAWADPTKRTGPKGTAIDSKITRYRPLTVIAEKSADISEAKKRAQWESSVRAARSVVVEVDVQGFRQIPGGDLWQPNIVVGTEIPKLQVQTELLITRVKYSQSLDQGSITTLPLMASKAFDPQPDIVFDIAEESGDLWG